VSGRCKCFVKDLANAKARGIPRPEIRGENDSAPTLKSPQNLACCHRPKSEILNQMVKHTEPAALDSVFAALSDPTRRRILNLLARAEFCVTEVAKSFSVSLPAISKHLRVLEKAGLIRRERDGRVHRLRLEAKPMRDAAAWIERYRGFWEGQFDQLADYLKKQESKEDDHG
jgi:DNA-binding transcriptional ArsR family regulator